MMTRHIWTIWYRSGKQCAFKKLGLIQNFWRSYGNLKITSGLVIVQNVWSWVEWCNRIPYMYLLIWLIIPMYTGKKQKYFKAANQKSVTVVALAIEFQEQPPWQNFRKLFSFFYKLGSWFFRLGGLGCAASYGQAASAASHRVGDCRSVGRSRSPGARTTLTTGAAPSPASHRPVTWPPCVCMPSGRKRSW